VPDRPDDIAAFTASLSDAEALRFASAIRTGAAAERYPATGIF
jgi:hypothetical protein